MELTREMGTMVNVSIGTAMAVEYMIKKQRELPSEVWFNIRTVFRNLYTSLPVEVRDSAPLEEIAKEVLKECVTIATSLEFSTGDRSRIVFYHCSFDSLNAQFEHARYHVPKTEKQKRAAEAEALSLTYIREHEAEYMDFRAFDVAIKGKDAVAWIVTHLPIDLLSRRFFNTLTLLETHTGALKTPKQWHTKLYKGKDLIRLPFNELMLQVYGDGNKQFNGFPIKLKNALYDLAKRRNWTPLTTRAKIREDLNLLDDADFRAKCKEMLANRVK